MQKRLTLILLCSMISCAISNKHFESMRLIQTIPLPGVQGRIDHMAMDIRGRRLFVAALGNDSLEIIDLRAGKRMRSITGLSEPQGVLFLPEFNKLYVTSGGDGTCRIFDGRSLALERSARFSGDADNIRYNPAMKQVYIGCCQGAIKRVDARTGTVAGETALMAHPEAFDIAGNTGRIFVNVPDAGSVVVIDSMKRKMMETWPVRASHENFPMALGSHDRRLIIGCRKPPKLLILNGASGSLLAQIPIDGDADDIFYDGHGARIYFVRGWIYRRHKGIG